MKCYILPNVLLVQICCTLPVLGPILIYLNNHKFLQCGNSAQNVSFLWLHNFPPSNYQHIPKFKIGYFRWRPNWLLCFHLKSNSRLKTDFGNYIVGIMWWTVVPNIVRQAQWHICIGFGPTLIYHRFLIKPLLNTMLINSIHINKRFRHKQCAIKQFTAILS